MSRTYKATGINLKSIPLGESDRLLTILTREFGLVRAVALGSRKHNSKLGGRSGLFVVNELLIAKGRSLDKVTQAETLESYPGLGQDLRKLTASQYLAELSLCQALSDQPQEELFFLLNEHLQRLEQASPADVLAHLTHAIFQLLILAGIAPQVHLCCMTRQSLTPDWSDPNWHTGFSIPAGGTVTLEVLEQLRAKPVPKRAKAPSSEISQNSGPYDEITATSAGRVSEPRTVYRTPPHASASLNLQLTAAQLTLLQQLAQAELPQLADLVPLASTVEDGVETVWVAIERILRQYAQYHFDRPIRSAALIDACFLPLTTPSHPQIHDATA